MVIEISMGTAWQQAAVRQPMGALAGRPMGAVQAGMGGGCSAAEGGCERRRGQEHPLPGPTPYVSMVK